MIRSNLGTSLLAITLLLVFGISCKSLTSAETETVQTESNTQTERTANKDAPEPQQKQSSSVVSVNDKPEFAFSAEEIYKIHKNDKNAIKGEKYVDKIIAVTGRFKDIDLTKKDSGGGYQARMNAGGMFDWISCSVDEADTAEFEKLKKDEKVTFKGLGERFWLLGPRLKHCVVSEFS